MHGDSGFHHISTIQRDNDALSEAFPSVEVHGRGLHVYQDHGGGWCVWLNTECADFDGLCISVGSTRDKAIAGAVEILEAIVEQLQKPAW